MMKWGKRRYLVMDTLLNRASASRLAEDQIDLPPAKSERIVALRL
jgi:hypothetical protein